MDTRRTSICLQGPFLTERERETDAAFNTSFRIITMAMEMAMLPPLLVGLKSRGEMAFSLLLVLRHVWREVRR